LNQVDGTPAYEVIVIDNNSTDATPDVVQRYLAAGHVRYEFEARQGLSVARNRGVALARADLVAFTDDDVCVSRTWVRSIVQAFDSHPEADIVGGKVEPVWEDAPPAWLPQVGAAPLALADYGDEPFRITQERPVCLLGANLAVRRRALDRTGGFSLAVQRVRQGIGSTEDYEFQVRARAGGSVAVYEPRIAVRAPVPRERLNKWYHRAWHRGHGRFYALMRDPSFERSRVGAFLGVPAHVFRGVLREAAGWGACLLTRRGATAFAHELRLRFLIGYAVQRIFHGHE
jgi:GT2 family glycosyltransferase